MGIATIIVLSALSFIPQTTRFAVAPPMPKAFIGWINMSGETPIEEDGVPITVYHMNDSFYDNKTTNPSHLIGCNYLFAITAEVGDYVRINCTYKGESACVIVEAREPEAWTNITLFPNKWIEKNSTPKQGGFGEAVVGTGNYIYVIRSSSTGYSSYFWRYDPSHDNWVELKNWGNLSDSELPRPKSGATLVWDNNNYIYAMFGGAKSDSDRKYFYRYNITNNSWMQLADTPHAQGAGDAITRCGYDSYIYALMGSGWPEHNGTTFARYNCSSNSWENLTLNPSWDNVTDDGCSLIWTGGEYLYALRGEWNEDIPNGDFARYHIPTKTWNNLTPMPEVNGVGDGASLLWINAYEDFIFALGGGEADESEGYNFYCYSIREGIWEKLESIPYPVGYYVGNRLAYANNSIYYWQGAPSGWSGGNRFCQLSFNITTPLTVVYVNDDFNSSTSGWGYDHFDSIQDGVDAVADNGTVYVFNGTYYENVDITKDGINLIGEDKNTTIIDASTGAGNGILIKNHDNVTVSGFTIRNAYGDGQNGNGVLIWAYAYISGDEEANNNIISNCIIHNNTHQGVFIEVYDVGQNAHNNTISNCEIYDNGHSGVFICADRDPGGWSYAKNNHILNCKIHNNGLSGIASPHADGISITPEGEVSSTLISGCEFYGNVGYGVFIEERGGMADNNIIYHNNFLNATNNAYDECSNTWDNGYPFGGNHWSDFDEPSEGAWDNNSDSIVDTPYNIPGGSNQDNYPLTWHYWKYDSNCDGIIQKSEVIKSIQDYFDYLIEKWQVIKVIQLYFST